MLKVVHATYTRKSFPVCIVIIAKNIYKEHTISAYCKGEDLAMKACLRKSKCYYAWSL